MNRPVRFSWVDEGEALRRLDVDRDTLRALVADGRLKAFRGVGKGDFFRVVDLDALYTEIHGAPVASADEEEAAAEDGLPKRKVFDPAYKVHMRLQADLKWLDLTDDDLRAWVREMTPDGYARQRQNLTRLTERFERMVALMDEAAAGWQVLAAPPSTPRPATDAPRPARRPLPMAGISAVPEPTQPAPLAPTSTPEKRRGRPLPMAGAPSVPPPSSDEGR